MKELVSKRTGIFICLCGTSMVFLCIGYNIIDSVVVDQEIKWKEMGSFLGQLSYCLFAIIGGETGQQFIQHKYSQNQKSATKKLP